MKATLLLRNVHKSFGGLKAVNGVSLDIKAGSITGLIGPNGSGKTTLFNIISGVYKPDAGEIYFDGECVSTLPPYKVYEKGVVRSFQIPRLFKKMTVLDNMIMAGRSQIGDDVSKVFRKSLWKPQEVGLQERAIDLLKFLGLNHLKDTLPAEISGGQLKLLEIGRALMSDPKILLLDEPTAGVNPILANEIFSKIAELRDELGITFFIIEHRIELLFNFVDEVFVMHRGKIIAEGPPHKVTEDGKVMEVYLGES